MTTVSPAPLLESRALRCFRRAAAVAVLSVLLTSVPAARPIQVGAPIVSAPWSAADLLKKSVEYLRWKIPENEFELVWTPVDELESRLTDGTLDLAVLPSAPLNPSRLGAGRVIASVKTEAAPDPDQGSACLIVVRRGEAPDDFKTAAIGADSALSVPGHLACARELVKESGTGFETLEAHTAFYGDKEARRLLRDLHRGRLDVVFLRAGWAEDVRLASGRRPLADFTVLFEKTDGPAVRHSTAAYPAPTLVSGRRTTPEELQRILTALLTMPPDRLGARWTIPAASDAVNRLTHDLRIGPYEHLRHWTLQRIWTEYRAWVVAAGLLFLALLAHGWVLEKLVRRRTADLAQALIDQKKAERTALEKDEELKRVEQKTVASQLSSVFAHEVSGPISTLLNLTHGARLEIDRTLERDEPPAPEDLEAADERLADIEAQIGKVGDIVSRVRNYARGDAVRTAFSVKDALLAAARSVERLTGRRIEVSARGDATLTGDPLEAELVFTNLLKNAAEASENVKRPRVAAVLAVTDDAVEIDVTDNGPALADAAWENLNARHRRTTKAEGLGLGLSLTTSLLEKAGGSLAFLRRPEGGVTARVRLPKAS